jgi:hypothetical protein
MPLRSRRSSSLASLRGSTVVDAVHDLLADDPFIVGGTYFFWDPLAAALFVRPSLGTYASRRLLVTASRDSGAGWIVPSDLGSQIRVASDVRAIAFERAFLSTIAGSRVRDVRPAADLAASFGDGGCRLLSSRTLTDGPAVIVFRNRSSDPAVLLLASYRRPPMYRELLTFIGEPGSLVRGAPEGFGYLGTVTATAGADAWATVDLTGPLVAVACAVSTGQDDAVRVWPGGWLRVR